MTPDSRNTDPRHKRLHIFAEKAGLLLRNVFVAVASVLFIISIITSHTHMTLKLIAYLCGMAAYCCEYIYLTKGFSIKLPHRELFMVYCFTPLYLLMGISYIMH